MTTFYLLLIPHLLVDYYFYNDEMYEKNNNNKFNLKSFFSNLLFKHSLLYFLISLLILLVYIPSSTIQWVYLILVLISHGLIDVITVMLSRKVLKNYRSKVYIVDQLIHILILAFFASYVSDFYNNGIIYELIMDNQNYLEYVLAFLLVSKVANITFKVLFKKYKPEDDKDSEGHENGGALIGSMERILILICLISSNFSTIGFVLTAKSVARFKKLSETKFGEYFIIGTLYSVLYTMIVYYLLFVL